MPSDPEHRMKDVLSMKEEAKLERERQKEHRYQEGLAEKIATKLAAIMAKKTK